MAQKKADLLFLEAAEQRGSGWFLDGTQDSQNPIELRAADRVWIPNTGFKAVEVAGEDGAMHIEHREVRYVAHDRSIDVDDQVKRKVRYEPRDAKNDANKITMEKGIMTIIKTPSNKNLTDYLETVFWNADAPNRPAEATALYRVVRLDKKARLINEDDMVETEAKSLVYRLQKKDGEGGYIFDEDKIDSYCKIMDIHGGETYDEKIYALSVHAKADPLNFVNLISTLDNTMNTEVSQALETGVIEFVDGNLTQFKDGTKIIKYFGEEKMNKKQQIEKTADFLKTSEGNESLTEMRTKFNAKKNKTLSNK